MTRGDDPDDAAAGDAATVEDLARRVAELEAANAQLRADLAARAEVEAELRAAHARYFQLIETTPHIVWIARPDGWHIHFNQRWMDFTGLTLEESLGDGWNPPFHPEDRPRAAARWDHAVRTGEPYEIEYRLRRADGRYHWMLGRAMPLRDDDGVIVRWFGTLTDIEDLKRAEARIVEQARLLEAKATQDPLTGLPNRFRLFEQLELLLSQRERAGVAVAFVDLDGFKAINDRCGHRAGDEVLVDVGERLEATVRRGDLVARIGGDEFVVVGEATDEGTALELGERIATVLRRPTATAGCDLPVSASVGVAFVGPDEDAVSDELISRADTAMYAAKRSPRGPAAIERPGTVPAPPGDGA